MESVGLSEIDLQLLHALQISPRAPWNVVGRVLGISPATAARHWERLRDAGMAWVTAYRPDMPGRSGDPVSAFVITKCAPSRTTAIAAELAGHPQTLSVEIVSGDGDLLVTMSAADRHALADYLLGRFTEFDGLLSSSTYWATRLYTEGSQWRLEALTPHQARTLREAEQRRDPAALRPREVLGDAADQHLTRLLALDGRTSFADLAEQSGMSEPTVRRRLRGMTGSGRIAVRCDLAWEAAGWPVSVHITMRVPPSRLDDVARALAVLPETRVVATCVGEADLIAGLWLPSLADAHRLAAVLAVRLPEVRIVRWLTGLRTVKRMGRLLDHQGRARPMPTRPERTPSSRRPGPPW